MGRGAFRKRIIEMGFVQGQEVEAVRSAPLGDPVYYKVMGYNVSLSKSDAELVEVVSMNEYQHEYGTITDTESQVNTLTTLSHEDLLKTEGKLSISHWSVIRIVEKHLCSILHLERMSM